MLLRGTAILENTVVHRNQLKHMFLRISFNMWFCSYYLLKREIV